MSGRGLVESPAGDAVPSRGLASIIEELQRGGERSPLLVAFARTVLRRVPAALLDRADAIATAAALADAFAFVDNRRPGEIAVRVVDPDVTLDGGIPTGTVVDVISDDRQFIVASVKEELHRLGYELVRNLHPVLGCERGPDGKLVTVHAVRGASHRESFLRAELGERVAAGARMALVESISRVLDDVFAVTGDHDAMRDRIAQVADTVRANAGLRYPADQVSEAADLLEWLLAGNFVLSGCCELAPTGSDAEPNPTDEPASIRRPPVGALGILARPGAPLLWRPAVADGRHLLQIGGTPEISTVYRQVSMQCIDVARVDASGDVAGVFRVVGVLTHRAMAEPSATTPVVGYKLRRILELEDVLEGSQDEAALVSLFQALPTDELLQTDIPALRATLVELLAAEHEHDVRALLRADIGNKQVSALISVPTELYSSALRRRLERFLMVQLDGTRIDADVRLADRPEAILRLVVHVAGATSAADLALDALEREVRLLCRTWDQELLVALGGRVGEERAGRLTRMWAEWFPSQYRDAKKPHQAIDDVLLLDDLLAGDPIVGGQGRIRVVLTSDLDGRAQGRLKVFSAGAGVELSQFLPIIESLGLWAVEDVPYVLGDDRPRGRTDDVVHLHDFGVRDPTGAALDVEGDGPRLAEAALALWHGRADADPLNRLVLRSAMSWDDVAVLRAYLRYRKQVGTAFTTDYVAQVLTENAGTAKVIVDLFAARFDPSLDAGPEFVAELRNRIIESCDAVSLLDHDRILRGFLGLVDATVRTNRYLGGGAHLALKFQSASVPDLARPVPHREIFVHGPAVEGIHLRWGPVARGGIRWSDRLDDYRTEVLDLMRAQVLKNAVIVPTGAKGGFVVKRPRYGTQAIDAAQAYEIFITALLDVTDNVIGDIVAPVPRRRDADDPYLVVAADRGTATFSDLANRISLERGFWLGDAFASGGSGGYDHKRLGITARGAWVAVRHHFVALGIDPGPTSDTQRNAQRVSAATGEPVTVVAIGDMSGDVFGNAMLRSDQIRLVAAFDHRDIFIDPDPHPATSYEERARLFSRPRSSWQDYDPSLISRGGGVWSRLEKRILLSSEAQALLRMSDEYPTSAELIRAILRAPTDLLFAGGVGTFVRASTEADAQIDDRANAEVRVEASTVRARVVGEGANLAFTQRARIEYARRGGHINTDAIDNSAGVDISDHEVNLKILLALAVESGEVTTAERNRLLHDVCDDVVATVLHNCSLQSMALSRAHAASPGAMLAMEALLVDLEATGVLDRAVEAMPSTVEMGTRARAGAGLTRPELAVLLAGAKRSLGAALLVSPVPDQAAAREVLVSYFPSRLAERLDHLLDRHHLRRELVASVLANEVVNRMGATFVHRLTAEVRARPASVVAAYVVARRVAGADQWWQQVDRTCEGRSTEALVASAAVVSNLVEALTRTYLRRGDGDDIAAAVARDGPVLSELRAALPAIGTPYRHRLRERVAETLAAAAVGSDLADQLMYLDELAIGPDVAELARTTGRSVAGIAAAMLWVGESLGVDRLVERVGLAVADDRWSIAVRRGLVDDLTDLRRLGARRALQDHPDQQESDAVIRFLAERVEQIGEVARLVSEVEGEDQPRLDAVTVATRAVRRAIG
ncbi:MAG: NAD-glutamate dehydrogenase [Actinomycetota bacterium]|nr:NAD-glutamate dehydrogenase [Actinomycetota bacterium]